MKPSPQRALAMSIQEIEQAITQLAPNELAQLREWISEFSDAHHESIDIRTPTLGGQRHSTQSPYPPSDIQPEKFKTPEEWITAFNRWVESHADVTAIADDSRESIY